MHQFSDSDSDSDKGIRYKTDSTRNKIKHDVNIVRSQDIHHSRERRYERYRRHGKDRSKRQRSRSNSKDSKHDRHKRKSERKSCARERNSRKSKDNKDTKNENEVKESLQKSKVTTTNDYYSDINKDNATNSRENMFGPSLPPHLQKEPDSVKKPDSSSGLIENDIINKPSQQNSIDLLADTGLPQRTNTCGPAVPNNLEEKQLISLNIEQPKNLNESSVEKADDSINQLEQYSPPQLMDNDPTSVLKSIDYEGSTAIIGPALPPHLQKKEPIQSESVSAIQAEEKSNSLVIGPALPPDEQKKSEKKQGDSQVVGPALPPHLQKEVGKHGQDESDEDDTYGPLPPGMSAGRAHVELEERALQLKIDQLGPKEDEEPKREEWMLELPEAKAASFGLGPRQFRAREGPDMSDRSSWTTTPKDAGKKTAETKVDLKQESRLRHIKEKDKQQEEIKSEEPAERRPFSRDIDLQVRRLDEAQKKAVLKSAQMLDDKFSSGQARYL
nr:unnamed protein product [Callosobruchus analis]